MIHTGQIFQGGDKEGPRGHRHILILCVTFRPQRGQLFSEYTGIDKFNETQFMIHGCMEWYLIIELPYDKIQGKGKTRNQQIGKQINNKSIATSAPFALSPLFFFLPSSTVKLFVS